MKTTQTGTATEKATVVRVPGAKVPSQWLIERAQAQASNPISTQNFVETALGKPTGKIHTLSRTEITGLASHPITERNDAPKVSCVSPLIAGAHGAFDLHQGLSLRPEVLWFAVLHEVAHYVRENQKECAAVFNGDPKQKKVLRVRDDSLVYGSPANNWTRTLQLFRPQLEEQIDNVSAFVPEFSTLDDESRVTLLGAFMEAASSYYSYEVYTRCGIPMLRFVGAPEDWQQLVTSAQTLQSKIPGLQAYLTDLIPILKELTQIVERGDGDEEILRSPYKFESFSGTATVTGWLTALMAFQPDRTGKFLLRTEFDWRKAWFGANDFPSHVSATPVLWDYYGQPHELQLVTGIIGADFQDGFIEPRLGWGLTEPSVTR